MKLQRFPLPLSATAHAAPGGAALEQPPRWMISTDDHQPLLARRVLPGDLQAVSHLLQGLSDRTRRLRYHIPPPATAENVRREAQRIVGGHTRDHLTLIASAEDHAIVAVAELVRDAQQPATGEIALIVRDDLQGRGIGTALLRRIANIAPAIGIATLHAHLLPENRVMLAVIRKLGRPSTMRTYPGELEVSVQLF
jgi:GNAT superfamily N-acetyltransferase